MSGGKPGRDQSGMEKMPAAAYDRGTKLSRKQTLFTGLQIEMGLSGVGPTLKIHKISLLTGCAPSRLDLG